MAGSTQNTIFRVKKDGFHGELFRPVQDEYPGKALICFGGSDGKFELARMLATVFQARGLTTLALAYVMEKGLPDCFYHVPIDLLEAAAKRLHDMGYEKVGLWGISKGAGLDRREPPSQSGQRSGGGGPHERCVPRLFQGEGHHCHAGKQLELPRGGSPL